MKKRVANVGCCFLVLVQAACTMPNPEYEAGDAGPEVGGSSADQRPADRALPDLLIDDAQAPPDRVLPADVIEAGVDHTPDAGAPDRPVDQGPPPGPDLRTGLIGYWQFNDAAGSTTAKASVGGAQLDGKLEGLDAATAWGRPGKFETAIEFPRVGRAPGIQVQATAAINALLNYTVAAWIYRTMTTGNTYDFIVSRQVGDSDAELLSLLVLREHLRAYSPYPAGGPAVAIEATGTIPVQTWTHVAVTYDGNNLTLYQNGSVANTLKYPLVALPVTTKPLYLGANKNADPNGAQPFVGYLDELMIYSVALTATQIKALADGSRPQL
jgi:hypothetical protein